MVCGNGGSASDAMHITGELVGRFNYDRPAINAVCLNVNPTVITAWSNDVNYETVFARQVEAHQGINSVLWGLSTSRNSVNVLRAFEQAGELGMQRILMTDRQGGSINNHCEIVIDVPVEGAPHIQELHIMVYRYERAEIEQRLLPPKLSSLGRSLMMPESAEEALTRASTCKTYLILVPK